MKTRSPWLLLAAAYCTLPVMVGCAGFATESSRNRQIALTGLMALDTAQTVTIARSPCLHEANPIAAAVFGSDRPTPERVLLTNAVYITGHWLLGSYLDRQAERPVDLSITAEQDLARRNTWRTLRGIYQFVTALGHGVAVVRNQAKGIRPFSSFECGGAQ